MSHSLPFRAHRRDLGPPHEALPDLVAGSVVLAAGPRGDDACATGGLDGQLILCVADGAGGMSGGRDAARAVIDAAGRAVTAERRGGWTDLLADVDVALADRGRTTGVVVSIVGDQITGASVGDSRAWLFTEVGQVELTADQQRKPLIGSGRARPVAFSAPYPPGAVLVLASDGLWNYAKLADIRAAVMRGAAPRDLADRVRLPNGALQDDISIIVCRETPAGSDEA